MSKAAGKHIDIKQNDATGDSRLGAEGLITAHRVIETFGGTKELDHVRSDIFHSDKRVVLSALSALGRLKDKKSTGYITRHFTNKDQDIQCAAIEAIGRIGLSDSVRSLINLFKTSHIERVRCAALKSLTCLAQEKTAGGLDHGKGLIEFMGDPGGHLAQGRHFSCLDQLDLRFQPLQFHS